MPTMSPWEERLDLLLQAANDNSKAINEAAQSHKKLNQALIQHTALLEAFFSLVAYYIYGPVRFRTMAKMGEEINEQKGDETEVQAE